MKTLRFLVFSLAAGLVLTGAACRSKPAVKQASFDGRWSGYEQSRPGTRITVTFEAGRFAYWDAQTNKLGSGTFRVNDKPQPPQMDLTFEEAPSPDFVGKVGLAIYSLQGDGLIMAGCQPGDPQRPTSLTGGPGVQVFTFKRE